MTKRKWIIIGATLGILVLFGLILLTTFNFQNEHENITEDLTDNEPEEIVFQNSSDMSEADIRILVEEKRIALKQFFENAKYYNISEISSDYTKEDDEQYIVVDENFLNDFRALVTEDVYGRYWDELTEITPDKDVLLNSRVHRGPKDLFDSIASESAISLYNVNEEILILESATNDRIVARENIRLCPEDTEICSRNDFYRLILEKEEDIWKIAEFQEKVE